MYFTCLSPTSGTGSSTQCPCEGREVTPGQLMGSAMLIFPQTFYTESVALDRDKATGKVLACAGLNISLHLSQEGMEEGVFVLTKAIIRSTPTFKRKVQPEVYSSRIGMTDILLPETKLRKVDIVGGDPSHNTEMFAKLYLSNMPFDAIRSHCYRKCGIASKRRKLF